MERTNYGVRKRGSSKFVIVAPHAAGDDLRTGKLALKISKQLDAFVLINDRYVKHNNSRAENEGQKVENFNNLDFSHEKSEYVWNEKHEHMKEFYEHLEEFCEEGKKHGEGECVSIFVHGLKDNEKDVGIDIGFGTKLKGKEMEKSKLLNTEKENRRVMAEVGDILSIKENMEEKLIKDHGLGVGLGEFYAAWSIENGIQYLSKLHAHALQLEITHTLRKPSNLEYTSGLISNVLEETYSNLN